MQTYKIILNLLSQFEIIDFLYFEASLIDNIHISFAKIGLYVILSLVFIMNLAIFIKNFNWLVNNKWSISKESMYALIRKGLLIHGLKLFSVLVPYGCPFALLPFLVGWICNYLDFSLQVVKFKTKFCTSNSGVGNALTARNYSTLSCRGDSTHQCSVENYKLCPWWVTGFIDGEGSFHVSVRKNKDSNLGWLVEQRFTIGLHVKDKAILQEILSYLVVGKISKQGTKSVQLVVISSKELEAVIKHFNNYPLLTTKWADFKLFLRIYEMKIRKEHLTLEGLRQIIEIKAAMNLGLSEKLQLAFPDVVAVERPLVIDKKISDPNWLAGFTSAEGCYYINIFKSNSSKIGEAVKLKFQITQHVRNELLIKSFMKYFKCGNIYIKGNAYDFRVTKFIDITEKIIPFFKKYPVLGVKALDFDDWCKVAELMQEKKHLTQAGLEQIRQIKAGMNTGRKCKCNYFL